MDSNPGRVFACTSAENQLVSATASKGSLHPM